MRLGFLILMLMTGVIIAQEGGIVTIDSTRKNGVLCELLRQNVQSPVYAVHLENRSGRAARVDFRAVSRTVATWTGAVIMRASDTQTVFLPAGADYFGADIMTLTPGTVREKLETRVAADGTASTITVLELVEDGPSAAEREQAELAKTRQEAERLRQEVAELRQRQDAIAAAQQAVAETPVVIQVAQPYYSDLWCQDRYRRHCHPTPPIRPQPVATEPKRELTWEELRDQELANERKVWKNF